MYAFILIIWTTTVGSTLYVQKQVGVYTSERACVEAADQQNVSRYQCIKK